MNDGRVKSLHFWFMHIYGFYLTFQPNKMGPYMKVIIVVAAKLFKMCILMETPSIYCQSSKLLE